MPEGTELEATKLLLEKIKTEDTELIPNQTKHEELELQSAQPELQSNKPKMDIAVGKAKEPVLVKYVRRHHAPN